MLEFVQESGFDQTITLLRFAMNHGLIKGRNPSSYFESNPDVKFDTRYIVKELTEKPEILRALIEACREPLKELIPIVDTSNDNDFVRGSKRKLEVKQLMRDML